MKKKIIKTREEARQFAIDWSSWAGQQNLSYKELTEWYDYFQTLVERFGLLEEFKENGIV